MGLQFTSIHEQVNQRQSETHPKLVIEYFVTMALFSAAGQIFCRRLDDSCFREEKALCRTLSTDLFDNVYFHSRFFIVFLFLGALFWQNEKNQYAVGEEAEVACVSGHVLSGYQFLRCLPDQTWTQQPIECQRKKKIVLLRNKTNHGKIHKIDYKKVLTKESVMISEKTAF